MHKMSFFFSFLFFFGKPFFFLLLYDATGDIRSIRGLLEPNEGVIRPSPQPHGKHNFRNTVIMQSAVNCSILSSDINKGKHARLSPIRADAAGDGGFAINQTLDFCSHQQVEVHGPIFLSC